MDIVSKGRVGDGDAEMDAPKAQLSIECRLGHRVVSTFLEEKDFKGALERGMQSEERLGYDWTTGKS